MVDAERKGIYYGVWTRMLDRCLNPRYRDEELTVCEEWKRLSAFKKWFEEHYVEGWELDWRLFGEKEGKYSPETCCFLPRSVENLVVSKGYRKGSLPLGVSWCSLDDRRFRAMIKVDGQVRHLGCFDDIESARKVYMAEKMRFMAIKYQDRLETRAFEALYGWGDAR